MMDSSADEDELTSKKTLQDEGNGGVSPRTLQAIQSALTEDSNVSEDLCREVSLIPHQKKYVIISSSDDDDDNGKDQAESTAMERSVLDEAQEGGGVSPRTLLAIQRALGEKEPFTAIKKVEQVGLLSSSEEEEMEEVVGVKSKGFKAATLPKKMESEKAALETALSVSDLQTEEKTLPQGDEKGSGSRFLQEGSLRIDLTEEEEEKEEQNGRVEVKSEEDDSSSEG